MQNRSDRYARCALAGNPNCGKTTLFNLLTGSHAHVGNWPGVTVEKREGVCRHGNAHMLITDLPGIYSMSPFSDEEIIARSFILSSAPDVIINLVDATSLERGLYLTSQLLELDVPIVVALNMADLLEREGTYIDTARLERELGVPVCSISAHKGRGLAELMRLACKAAKSHRTGVNLLGASVARVAAEECTEILLKSGYVKNAIFACVKLLEEDHLICKELGIDASTAAKVSQIRKSYENMLGEGLDEGIADDRYNFITSRCTAAIVKTKTKPITFSDKLDLVLTGRITGIPIFLAIILSVFTLTFGESFLGIPLPGAVMQGLLETFIGGLIAAVSELLKNAGASELLHNLITDGILRGVGLVLAFLPQIMMLFFCLSLLEGTGYMARAAFMLDRPLRKLGLSGKAFVPLLMGFGCTVPAVMCTRTLEHGRERRLAILLMPFMSCSAKLPVYALFVSALFEEYKSLVLMALYLLGISLAIVVALVFGKAAPKKSSPPFILELPAYRLPNMQAVIGGLWEKLKHFLFKIATVLTAAVAVVWFLQNFSLDLQYMGSSGAVGQVGQVGQNSILSIIGRSIAPVFAPLGFGNAKAAIAVLMGFLAKEAVVSVSGFLYGGANTGISIGGNELAFTLTAIAAAFTPLEAFSFMVFNLLCPPCIAAISAIAGEHKSLKWTALSLFINLSFAWILCLIIYQMGRLFLGG